ncbi:MAG TPA: efflux RND transporter periplasmic adaptor subunit [Isosphaeraceae bacterium]
MFRGIVTALGLGALVVGLAAANLYRPATTEAIDWQLVKKGAKEVYVESPTRGPIVQTITAPGVVEPLEVARISSQVVGRVVALPVKEGDTVKMGDLLLKLEDDDARAKLASADARFNRLREAIAQVEADVTKAERDASQSGRLAGRGYTTSTELADSRTLVAKAQAALRMSRMELAESEAMRHSSQRDLERTEIRSPVDGIVSDLNVEVGEVVVAGTTNQPDAVLMNICNLSGMRIRADVDETDIPFIHRGQPAQVYLQADQRAPIAGKVGRIGAKGTQSGDVVNYETRIVVGQDSAALRAGMTATVEIEVRRVDDAPGVPVQAVVHRQRKDLPDTAEVRAWCERNARSPGERAREVKTRYIKVVFVVDRGIARARPVETGLSDERRVEILSGLKPNDRVIVGPFRTLDELRDGQSTREAPAEEPS